MLLAAVSWPVPGSPQRNGTRRLIAFGALEQLSPSGHVIFADISRDLLDHCQAAATAEGQLDRCGFVVALADSLTGIADCSVDVVTTRSVLIYVKDEAEALREFHRRRLAVTYLAAEE